MSITKITFLKQAITNDNQSKMVKKVDEEISNTKDNLEKDDLAKKE